MTEEFKRGPGRPPKDENTMFPVLLKRNYFPAGKFEIASPKIVEGEETGIDDWKPGIPGKVRKGIKIKVPKDEAVRIIHLGIAERADDL
jgi:hypothetical protein